MHILKSHSRSLQFGLLLVAMLPVFATGCGGGSNNTQPATSSIAPVESDKMVLHVPYIGQQANEWCWAASIQMVLANYSITYTQKQIVVSTYGINYDYPASAEQIQSELNKLSNGTFNAQIVNGQLTLPQIQQKIHQNIPIIVQYEANTDTQGHFVVIYGYDDAGNLLINDPLFGPYTVAYTQSASYQRTDGQTMYWILSIEV